MRETGLGWRQRALRRRGAVSVIVAAALVALFGFVALAVDVGYIYYNQMRLQAATDAAALAGGQDLWRQSWTQAQSDAQAYGADTGRYNALTSNITVSTMGIKGLQLASVPLSYSQAVSGYNAIQVTQTATVPTFFARVLGINSVKVTTISTASAGGGGAQPLNVVLVLDTTASMNSTDPNCNNLTKLQCAMSGVRTLMAELSAAGDNVGLVVFPPLNSTSAVSADASCNSSSVTTGSLSEYGTGNGTTSGIYNIVSPTNSSNYMSGGSLNTGNTLVKAVGGGGSGCSGIAAPGGMGTYYAQAISAAQATLAAMSATNKQQNVMVILSDGDASASSSGNQIISSLASDQCQQAIAAANSAKSAGTWIYAIAYQSATSGGCATDTSNYSSQIQQKGISPCATLQTMAGTTVTYAPPSTPPSYFYSDSSGCQSNNSYSSVSSLFSSVGTALLGSRLIPNGAT